MLYFRVTSDVVGRTRFAFSPLVELAASLRLLAVPHTGHLHQRWIRQSRELLADFDLSLLTALVPGGLFAPSFLVRGASSPRTTLEQQLHGLTSTDPDVIADDLVSTWQGRAMPPQLQAVVDAGSSGLNQLSDALWDYWQIAIAPVWPRICAVLEDDVAYRASHVLTGGLFALYEDLHPEITMRQGWIAVDKPLHAPQLYEGSELTLIPSVFISPGLVVDHDDSGEFSFTYAARGVGRTWEGLSEPGAELDHLAALLGRGRATILTRLSVPMTTTGLAEELRQSAGTVSQHLSTLRNAGLLVSRRSGRKVFYTRTPLATSLIEAALDSRRAGSA